MNRIFLIFTGLALFATSLTAQQQQNDPFRRVLSLEDVIELAQTQSLNALIARQTFRSSYYSYMNYRATLLPRLTLRTNPTSYDQSIQTVVSVNDRGEVIYRESRSQSFSSTAGLALTQNIGFTGGTISLGSDFSRRHNFLLDDDRPDKTTFTTTPVSLSLSQPLNGYNEFRWSREIDPLRFEQAKLNYIITMEGVASLAVTRFFALASALLSREIELMNLENNRQLYRLASGRYESGLIAEDALLQVQMRYLRAELALSDAEIQIQAARNNLRTFLGFREDVDIELVVNPDVPIFKVDFNEVLHFAMTRNPDIIAWQLQLLNAQRNLAQIRSQTGITVDLNASFGMNKTAYNFTDVYSPEFSDRYGVSMRINVPILDWGQQRNRNRAAQTDMEIAETRIQQAETDFRQDVFLQVMRFNMQEDQLRISALSDTIAQQSYNIAYNRYMVGRGDITVLNEAERSKDSAKRDYLNMLRDFWNQYYSMRQLTLFDFLNNRPLEEDFVRIL